MTLTERLDIFLLGGFGLRRGGQLVGGLESRKAEALLAFVACAGGPVQRETLAELFWGDRPQSAALGNLRVALTNLRAALGPHLDITRQTVQLIPDSFWLDARELERQIDSAWASLSAAHPLSSGAAGQLAAALDLYRGDFLQGYFVKEAEAFEEWAALERERLRRIVEDAHHDLIDFYLNTGDHRSGIARVERLLALDPLRESAHRQMMTLLARDGQTAAALAHYETCKRILADELRAQPAPETEALAARLRQAGSAYRHNLPVQTTPFIGREPELARLADLLANPAVRLVTIVGPGGMGKTRLALQAAAARIGAHLHGVWFVPLAGLSPGEASLEAALAEALSLASASQTDLKTQLFGYLKEREALLVFDNFEPLIESAPLLTELMLAGPHLTLLVTSRERLNLSGEILVEIAGLSLPPDSAADLEDYSAAQLFLQSARRLSPAVAASAWVARICDLTGGLPLALELAAAWVRVMPPEEIAREIEHNLDFLAAPLRDVPERHRSLRAVFEHSWRLMSGEERAAFARLSVFRGGFTREAAREVCGAAPPVLLALIDQSLLGREASGRYQLHPLLQQYAADKLAEAAPVREAHAAHYARWLQAQAADMSGPRQAEALPRVALEIENIRTAWQWLLAGLGQPAGVEARLELLGQTLGPLNQFYTMRCWFKEADSVLGATARALDGLPRTPAVETLLARVWACHSLSLRFIESAERSRHLAARSAAVFRRLGLTGELAAPLLNMGYLAMRGGDYDSAQALLDESLGRAREAGDLRGAAAALNMLAEVYDHRGDYARAKECDELHLELQRQLGDPRGIAKALNGVAVSWLREDAFERAETALAEAVELFSQLGDLNGVATAYGTRGNAAQYLGRYEAAQTYYAESLRLCREMGDFWGVALGLHNLGELAAARGHLAEAKGLYDECIVIYRRHDIRSGWMNALADRAHCCVELGEYEAAHDSIRQSMGLAREADEPPMMLKALAARAWLLARTSRPGEAARAVGLVLAHAATEETARKWMDGLRAELAQALPPEVLAHEMEQGRGLGLAAVAGADAG